MSILKVLLQLLAPHSHLVVRRIAALSLAEGIDQLVEELVDFVVAVTTLRLVHLERDCFPTALHHRRRWRGEPRRRLGLLERAFRRQRLGEHARLRVLRGTLLRLRSKHVEACGRVPLERGGGERRGERVVAQVCDVHAAHAHSVRHRLHARDEAPADATASRARVDVYVGDEQRGRPGDDTQDLPLEREPERRERERSSDVFCVRVRLLVILDAPVHDEVPRLGRAECRELFLVVPSEPALLEEPLRVSFDERERPRSFLRL
mmetsp:Transcript_13578/g.36063  ORF Transcript_13578/g.36063 Transcript_13578/m.36063 type:complete len:263 (+) Transcript_13578:161-949(+)